MYIYISPIGTMHLILFIEYKRIKQHLTYHLAVYTLRNHCVTDKVITRSILIQLLILIYTKEDKDTTMLFGYKN